MTDPKTGEIQASDDMLKKAALEQTKEYKALKALKENQNPESVAEQISKAEKMLGLVSIKGLIKSKRFVQAVVHRTYKGEDKQELVCSTLYHKRRNAWDMFRILGGEKYSGMPRPDFSYDREAIMKYLSIMYNEKLPQALDRMVEAAAEYLGVDVEETATPDLIEAVGTSEVEVVQKPISTVDLTEVEEKQPDMDEVQPKPLLFRSADEQSNALDVSAKEYVADKPQVSVDEKEVKEEMTGKPQLERLSKIS